MKFNLNKNKYSGGLCFGSIIAIVSILDCCAEVRTINNNDHKIKNNDISDIINLFNNISWRIIANNKIVDADKNNWITQGKYNESIIKVIAQAVADCITGKNEFKFKKECDVIIFDAEAKDYTAENWNAVVLWNYLHVLKWDYLKSNTRSKDVVFDEVRRRIYDKYQTAGVNDFDRKVNEAISDIKEYDKELSLADEMKKFSKVTESMSDGWTKTRIRDAAFDKITLSPIGSWLINKYRYNIIENGSQKQYILIEPEEFCTNLRNVSLNFNSEYEKYEPLKVKWGGETWIVSDYDFKIYAGNHISCETREISEQHTKRKDKWIAYYIIRDKLQTLFDDLHINCM